MSYLTKQDGIGAGDYLSLRTLGQSVERCRDCGLGEHRRHSVLFRGSFGPDPVLIVGEAPGEEEDKAGRPFIGRCGQLLSDRLFEASFFPHVIVNAVCCRPPGNRRPFDLEVQACSFHLREVVRILRPSKVLLLGATAAFALYNLIDDLDSTANPRGLLGRMKSTRGKLGRCEVSGWGQVTWVKTWHPGYVLRKVNKEAEQEFESDIRLITKLCEEQT